ncbi:TIGR02147 family protein [Pseudobacteriovorax antillogorgiicola]|uniref:TIGR02147 family protein n=1 Tax=Pseudobacteriovorax antillogorgiicola TaxID=1513793 RepID=A0A1Y6CVZ0_9BACT|nr:TIGR02147 family protein [Pseudobacteriovorax antillogorgiicola]TCS42215.1 uncharacterized protein (TIGR02147 family) [Pseudobacteriovorax antillogorgiicola]SMF82795.1 TIGR02147 family protein [Pseudobacteriovorax antillogorgiicola]
MNTIDLIRHKPGIDALFSILREYRRRSQKYSYANLSRHLGLKSRSYISECLSGKKKLNQKHVKPLIELLGLPPSETEMLVKKTLLDIADLNPNDRHRLSRDISSIEKSFSQSEIDFSALRNPRLSVLLSVSLYLFDDNRATLRQLVKLFGRDQYHEIELAIADLLRLGLWQSEGDYYKYPEAGAMPFRSNEYSRESEVSYLKETIEEAKQALQKTYRTQPESSIFQSHVLTVNRKQYQQLIDDMKQSISRMQSNIEVSGNETDSLVRFNVQVYPIFD